MPNELQVQKHVEEARKFLGAKGVVKEPRQEGVPPEGGRGLRKSGARGVLKDLETLEARCLGSGGVLEDLGLGKKILNTHLALRSLCHPDRA